MKLYVPDYYPDFQCIAQACWHTCCAGWEIDVDKDTLQHYRQMPGELGERLRNVLVTDEDGVTHFRLDDEERCPMLRQDGLCEIICREGQGALCQVCADHPRWRNFYSDRTEMGLGLCCEAAVDLILHRETPCTWVDMAYNGKDEPLDPEEAELLALRERLTACLQNRALPWSERRNTYLRCLGLPDEPYHAREAAKLLSELERLDPLWEHRLSRLSDSGTVCWECILRAAENLSVYLLWRHLPGGLEDGMWTERALLALWGTETICRMAENELDLPDAARMFSSEIEYSDENMDAILTWLGGTHGTDTVL